MPAPRPATAAERPEVAGFLAPADLTTSGLDSPAVFLWLRRGAHGVISATTGFGLSADGAPALVRGVAVRPDMRGNGVGVALATFGLAAAERAGARRAWLSSRKSGEFWQKPGFAAANRDALADALPDTHQVRAFRRSGQFAGEVAWSRPLDAHPATPGPRA